VEKSEEERPILALTNNSVSAVNTSFPVLIVKDPLGTFWELVYDNYDPMQLIAVYREYRENQTQSPDLTWFSSLGPSLGGLIKPDVVGPGSGIVSARSVPGGGPNHDLDPFDGHISDGTSMSCPNIAGSAALLTQYFRQVHGINPSSSLIYATIIGSADPGYPNVTEPGLEFGFGIVNIAAHVPINTDSFKFLFADEVNISDRQHLVATVNVTSAHIEFRVTIAFLDVVTNLDGYIPLVGELALIVESPSGKLIRGNQHPDNTEEHFSTRQRVILFPWDLETGVWTVHVIANLLPSFVESVLFAAVARGAFNDANLTFTETTECIDCESGLCDNETGLCNCSAGRLGQSCQFAIENISVDSPRNISLNSSGNAYVALAKPAGSAGNLTLCVNITDTVSLNSYPVIHAGLSEGQPPSAFPHDYDHPIWGNVSFIYDFVHDNVDSAVDGLLIHNPQSWTATYTIRTKFVPFATPQFPNCQPPTRHTVSFNGQLCLATRSHSRSLNWRTGPGDWDWGSPFLPPEKAQRFSGCDEPIDSNEATG
jgi:hypothetical protein